MPNNKRIWKGKTQYKSQFRWTDEDGITHKSNTGWCDTKLEADKEAERLKKEKSKPVGKPRSAKKIETVFNEYMAELERNINDGELNNKSSTITMLERCNSIKNKYFPAELKNMMVKEVNPAFFRRWLEHINKQKISGHTVRSFKVVLQKFNKFLADNGYYSHYNMDVEIAIALGRVNLKPRKSGERKDRKVPTQLDIEDIANYYLDDLGKFRNFYYYTFFYFEFYTGMRVSETVALQWKNVDLREDYRVIHIINGINEKEKRNTALKRTEIGNYSTKNETSERGIVIFDKIYQLLLDYRNRYMTHYNLSEEETEECFVFPALKDPHKYAKHGKLLEELKRACEGAGIEELDNGMFRHGCATWLVAPKPLGMGYSAEQVFSHMGHCDSKMILDIYGKLEKQQITEKNKETFTDIYHPKENKDQEEIRKENEYRINLAQGNNKPAEQTMKMYRFMQELDHIREDGKHIFYYYEIDEEAIEKAGLREIYKDINFIKRDGKK